MWFQVLLIGTHLPAAVLSSFSWLRSHFVIHFSLPDVLGSSEKNNVDVYCMVFFVFGTHIYFVYASEGQKQSLCQNMSNHQERCRLEVALFEAQNTSSYTGHTVLGEYFGTRSCRSSHLFSTSKASWPWLYLRCAVTGSPGSPGSLCPCEVSCHVAPNSPTGDV